MPTETQNACGTAYYHRIIQVGKDLIMDLASSQEIDNYWTSELKL